jgi:sugar O-acyltransferase (sialic acid O-acetyltransferase NeuD family)
MKNKTQNLIILGAGDFAKKIIRLAQSTGQFNILGYTNPEPKGSLFGVPFLGPDDVLEGLIKRYPGCGAVLGFAGNMKLRQYREKLITDLKRSGFVFPTIVAGDALIEENVELSEGVIVFNRAIIDFNTKIGAFSVVNLTALLGHDITVGENSVISPMGMIGGGTKIGNNCFIGMNATINPYLTIGNQVIIGAASMVVKDCPEEGTYVGNPVKKVK